MTFSILNLVCSKLTAHLPPFNDISLLVTKLVQLTIILQHLRRQPLHKAVVTVNLVLYNKSYSVRSNKIIII